MCAAMHASVRTDVPTLLRSVCLDVLAMRAQHLVGRVYGRWLLRRFDDWKFV
jgi:hypothetical protein